MTNTQIPPILTKQAEREQRILDAAAELILRWGYDKTTIDDIAKKAGVAKGTIYLHWKTREALFEALLRRESLALGEDFRLRIAEDLEGATLRVIYKQAALALMQRPLLKAVLLGDRDIIGKLARTEQNRSFYAQRWAGFFVFLEFLRERDLIRTDINLQAQAYAVAAIFSGFFMLGPIIANDIALPDAEIAELIGEAIHRTLETNRVVQPEEIKSVTAAFIAYLDQSMAGSEAQPDAAQHAVAPF